MELHPLLAQRKLVGVCYRKVCGGVRWGEGGDVYASTARRRQLEGGRRSRRRCFRWQACVISRPALRLTPPPYPTLPARLPASSRRAAAATLQGVHCVAYSPLGHGQGDLLSHPAVAEVAAAAGKTPAQVLLKWNVQRGVAVVPKAGSEPHLRENIEGLFAWRLTWDQKVRAAAWRTRGPGDGSEGAALACVPLLLQFCSSSTPPPPVAAAAAAAAAALFLQAKLDALDCGRRFVDCDWHQWEDPEEGGAPKPSLLL